MALNYSVSLRTNPIKKDEPAKAYATAQINGELSLKQLSRRVSMQTTVSRADMEPEFTQFAEIHLFPLLEGIEQVLDSGDQYRHHIRPADGGLHGYPAAQLLER